MGEAKRTAEAAKDHAIEPEYRDAMIATVDVLDDLFNPAGKDKRQVGVVVLVFPVRDKSGFGKCNFLSNDVEEADLERLFEALALRFVGVTDPGEAN